MRRAIKLLISVSFLSIAVCLAASLFPFAAAQMQVDFKRDIEPILAASCYQCHGAKKAAGQLRLDSKAAAIKGTRAIATRFIVGSPPSVGRANVTPSQAHKPGPR